MDQFVVHAAPGRGRSGFLFQLAVTEKPVTCRGLSTKFSPDLPAQATAQSGSSQAVKRFALILSAGRSANQENWRIRYRSFLRE
ncbi:MAG: hypothetical protein CMJ81_10495 [Planctomycetaceae bacterium]|nr:hypothetical protein [Planctomycetaceae bacterium]